MTSKKGLLNSLSAPTCLDRWLLVPPVVGRMLCASLSICMLLACGDGANGLKTDDRDGGISDDSGSGGNLECPTGSFSFPGQSDFSIADDSSWSDELDVENSMFFASTGTTGAIRFVKFHVPLSDNDKVIFQDTRAFQFHYDFATAKLGSYVGISVDDYNAIALKNAGRELLLGSVLSQPTRNEVAFQFAGNDAIHPELVVHAIKQALENMTLPTGTKLFYFPAASQTACNDRLRVGLDALGVTISGPERWAEGDQCYSGGWAVGRLKYVEADDVEAAYEEGRLLPTDILLVDQVPAEVPPVAGIISEAVATPNSHVSILARTFGIPFAWFQNEETRAEIKSYDGKRIGLNAGLGVESCILRAIELEGYITEAQYNEVLAFKTLPTVNFPARTSDGTFVRPVGALTNDDAKLVGGKAANFGYLRRAIPDNSPAEAIAFSFDLWDEVLALNTPDGEKLADYIDDKLSGYSYPVADFASLKSDLDDVRDTVRDIELSDSLKTKILEALGDFDEDRKVRFRSSTNLEDGDTFSGAGLYSSYSGCIGDDTDADEDGPSACDAGRDSERGVFRAIRRTLASLYNDNAFLERLRFKIDESKVGMAVLAHYSFPDPEEEANGVITIETSEFGWMTVTLVSQIDAHSISNPEGGHVPEVYKVAIYDPSIEPTFTLTQGSSLVPVGGTVLQEADYKKLVELVLAVRDIFPDGATKNLDFEYKKMSGKGLVIKQVRPLPILKDDTERTPLVTSKPVKLCVSQDEIGDVLANHRAKGVLEVGVESFWATDAEVASNRFNKLSFRDRAADGDLLFDLSGAAVGGLDYEYGTNGMMITTEVSNSAQAPRSKMSLVISKRPALIGLPVVELFEDYYTRGTLTTTYSADVPRIRSFDPPDAVSEDNAFLRPCSLREPHVVREFAFSKGTLAVEGSAWRPRGGAFTKTYTITDFIETKISGLTTEPLVLTAQAAQSFKPEHHNFSEHFAFEPAMDPGLSSQQRQELEDQGIVLIVFQDTESHLSVPDIGTVWKIGADGVPHDITP